MAWTASLGVTAGDGRATGNGFGASRIRLNFDRSHSVPHLIELTDGPIDCSQVLSSVQTTQAGAVVLFLGTVREFTQGRQTTHLHYDAYRPMAETKLAELANEASQRWPILNAAIVHRLGHMDLGDVSVAVAVSSPHRPDAFEAGRYLIDRLKEVVPIWKQEHWSDGAVEWVHPAPDTPPS